MEDEKVTFETAKLAKEKGFDEPVNGTRNSSSPFPELEGAVQRPTQSLLQKWIRETHNIEVYVLPYSISNNHKMIGGKGYYEVVVDKAVTTWSNCTSWEEALEIGLQEALKLIPNKNG